MAQISRTIYLCSVLIVTLSAVAASAPAGLQISQDATTAPIVITVLRRKPQVLSSASNPDLPHASCQYDGQREGVCTRSPECRAAGGRFNAENSCNLAGGSEAGVCCLLQQTCGGQISSNNTFFVNPEYPHDTRKPETCEISVAAAGACFLRLDFESFTIQDSTNGNCMTLDQLTVPHIDIDTPISRDCDEKTLIYINVRKKRDHTVKLNLGQWDRGRQWRIRVSTIECNKDWSPPEDVVYHYGHS